MRTNLIVPYAEKDKAKALGAKWDAAKRVWYVEDLPNLVPFLKWMPEHLRRPVGAVSAPAKKKSKSKQVKSKKAYEKAMKRLEAKNTHFIVGPTTPRTDFSMFDPGCSCVPWEWCEHNPQPDVPIAVEQLEHIRSIIAQ